MITLVEFGLKIPTPTGMSIIPLVPLEMATYDFTRIVVRTLILPPQAKSVSIPLRREVFYQLRERVILEEFSSSALAQQLILRFRLKQMR